MTTFFCIVNLTLLTVWYFRALIIRTQVLVTCRIRFGQANIYWILWRRGVGFTYYIFCGKDFCLINYVYFSILNWTLDICLICRLLEFSDSHSWVMLLYWGNFNWGILMYIFWESIPLHIIHPIFNDVLIVVLLSLPLSILIFNLKEFILYIYLN